jgi:cysteine desulfurase / selenocysteine lyase
MGSSRSAVPLLSRDLFLGLDGKVAHLAAGGETPPVRSTAHAVSAFLAQKSRGMAGRDEFTDHYRTVKRRLAGYLSLPASAADRIAFLGSAAEGINRFADGMDWRPGDEVVSLTDEYPNALLPWLSRAHLGVKLVAVDPGDDAESAIAAAVTERTRVICVSHVSYLNGRRLRLDRLRTIADGCGAALVVDASQSLGVLPVNAELCDVMVSCCYKFILGIHGIGIFYCNDEVLDQLTPKMVGWHSIQWPSLAARSRGYELKEGAARLELGNPPFVSVVALDEGLKVLESISPARLEEHVMALGGQLRAGLDDLGARVWHRAADESTLSANVVFGDPDADQTVSALADDGVLAWSGDGRVRLSLHGYNDDADVAAALDALARLEPLRRRQRARG